MSVTVTMSSKNQIVIPREAREKLRISPGNKLLVLCKDDQLVLIPRPRSFVKKLAGLHKEIWEGTDAGRYLDRERDSWS